ncbi:MAG: DUF547 domain-containing protein [Gemmatimonadota bacterium]|nr:DUF547 domain-containing protein [Gemmatimonadota bacterium]
MDDCTLAAGTEKSNLRTYGALAAFVLLIVAAVIAAKSLGLFDLTDRKQLTDAIQRVQGVKGIAIWFVLAYALIAGLGLPATPLTLAGGAIFGTALGSGLNWLGAVLGATIGHLLARQLGSDGVKRLLGKHAAKLEALSKTLTFTTILRLRLIPVTPFNLLNFASGLARVPLRAFVPATAIGILPGTIIYTFFSDSLIGGVAGAKTHALLRMAIAGALLILISFLPKLFQRGKQSGAAAILLISAVLSHGGLLAPRQTTAQSAPAAIQSAPPTVAGPTFDHSAFDQLLQKHVVGGLVDYNAFEHSAEFQRYLDALAAAKPATLAPAEGLAFWINAYNAYTIALMNQHHERKSIRNINKTFGLISIKGPWTERMARVGGETYTLLHIENEIIRQQYHDPRIHFAIVCASLGCPPLRSEAFTGARLEQQLDDQARTFLLKSPAKNRVDVATRTVFVSPIFEWYRDDFGGSDKAVGKFIAQFYTAGPERDLLLSGDFSLKETDYDWSINVLKPTR